MNKQTNKQTNKVKKKSANVANAAARRVSGLDGAPAVYTYVAEGAARDDGQANLLEAIVMSRMLANPPGFLSKEKVLQMQGHLV